MARFSVRRVFRVLWALCAVCLLAGLPALILDFKRNEYSVHYQVCRPARPLPAYPAQQAAT